MISVLSQEGHAKVGVYEYVIDTVAELSNVPTDVHAGSMVYCIENSKKYMLNNAGTYVEVNFKKGGSGGEAKLGSKDISENGTYRASEFDLDGWSQVNVDVENTYYLTDEGKVVQNGALVSQTSTTKTANGTYDTTANNQVVINVPIPSGYIQPTGTSNITSNGIYDITSFASVDVNVSGGGIVPLVDETMSISTSSTSTATVKTYETSLSALGGKTLHMRVYDTNGIRTNYFYSYDQIYANTPNGGYALLASIACFDSSGNFSTRYEAPTDNQYGVFFSCSSMSAQDKLRISVQKKYNSTKTKTINGKFRVLIFAL